MAMKVFNASGPVTGRVIGWQVNMSMLWNYVSPSLSSEHSMHLPAVCPRIPLLALESPAACVSAKVTQLLMLL